MDKKQFDDEINVAKRVAFFNNSRTSVHTLDGFTCDICDVETPYTKVTSYTNYSGKVKIEKVCEIKLCPTCLEMVADVIRSRIDEENKLDAAYALNTNPVAVEDVEKEKHNTDLRTALERLDNAIRSSIDDHAPCRESLDDVIRKNRRRLK